MLKIVCLKEELVYKSFGFTGKTMVGLVVGVLEYKIIFVHFLTASTFWNSGR